MNKELNYLLINSNQQNESHVCFLMMMLLEFLFFFFSPCACTIIFLTKIEIRFVFNITQYIIQFTNYCLQNKNLISINKVCKIQILITMHEYCLNWIGIWGNVMLNKEGVNLEAVEFAWLSFRFQSSMSRSKLACSLTRPIFFLSLVEDIIIVDGGTGCASIE